LYSLSSGFPAVAVVLPVALLLEAPQAGEVIVPIWPLPPAWSFLSENPEPQMSVANGGVMRIPGFAVVSVVMRWNTLFVWITPEGAPTVLHGTCIPRMVMLQPS
jgi:hypothetical protein